MTQTAMPIHIEWSGWKGSEARKRIGVAIAALSMTALSPHADAARTIASPSAPAQRYMTQLIGANGWPTSDEEIRFWQCMGLSWGRDSVGPGAARSAPGRVDIGKTGPGYDLDLPSIILRNNRSGIKSLLLLGYTPDWNASVSADWLSAPKDVSVWERYVEAVVKKYSAPPYNIKYFQIWNEAAGELSGGSPQATFWHGPGFNADPKRSRPYARAMQDYVERVHIPAAKIVRKYHASVVYGGWPDQGGLENYFRWLEYTTPAQRARMLDWVDYLDVHYLGVPEMEALYQRYVKTGMVRGIWQTEVGDAYINDRDYLPTFFFELAVWALDRNWDHADKYVSMIYHWDGGEPYRLTHRGPPRAYNPSGRSLITLTRTVSGALAPFPHPVEFSAGASGKALYSDSSIVFQVSSTPGRRSLVVRDLPAPIPGGFAVDYIDAMQGETVANASITSSWQGTRLSIGFNVPAAAGQSRRHLGYLVVTPCGGGACAAPPRRQGCANAKPAVMK